MSLQDHVAQNRATGDARTEAETTLLNAITKTVQEVEAANIDFDARGARLKGLAEAYALVVHGKQ
ncbi:hypothetical protein [Streptomyces tendae]|uniref:hypothetical protein n=1 Tax=Streptomyces tendae TaxID=1932 RepID=UPI003813B106